MIAAKPLQAFYDVVTHAKSGMSMACMDSTVWGATMAAAASKLQSIPHQRFHGWPSAFLAN